MMAKPIHVRGIGWLLQSVWRDDVGRLKVLPTGLLTDVLSAFAVNKQRPTGVSTMTSYIYCVYIIYQAIQGSNSSTGLGLMSHIQVLNVAHYPLTFQGYDEHRCNTDIQSLLKFCSSAIVSEFSCISNSLRLVYTSYQRLSSLLQSILRQYHGSKALDIGFYRQTDVSREENVRPAVWSGLKPTCQALHTKRPKTIHPIVLGQFMDSTPVTEWISAGDGCQTKTMFDFNPMKRLTGLLYWGIKQWIVGLGTEETMKDYMCCIQAPHGC